MVLPTVNAHSGNKALLRKRNSPGQILSSKLFTYVSLITLLLSLGVLMIWSGNRLVAVDIANKSLPLGSSISGPEKGTLRIGDERKPVDLHLKDKAPKDGLAEASTDQIVIGYAVSVTGCGSDPLTEGAAVLGHSIHRAHQQSQRYPHYKLYAIYHPQAESCAQTLEALGYQLLRRETPVHVAEIQGEYLRSKIESNGCCGEKELIKLEAYTLTDHPIVVHLDLDTLVLKPLDDLYDLMLRPRDEKSLPDYHQFVMWREKPLPTSIDAFFTMDYNMVKPYVPYKPVQGGFLVLRPNHTVYEEFRDIVRKGDFQPEEGWGGKVGPFYGSMTFQGLIPYYYNVLHQGRSVELNRCIYNQMCDNPRTEKTVRDVVSGPCRTGQPEDQCEDCRSRPLTDVVTVHFTLCQKPWMCLPQSQDIIQQRLCRQLHHQWYSIRSALEQSWGRSGMGPGSFDPEHFFGYCNEFGKKGYLPIQPPYGQEEVKAS